MKKMDRRHHQSPWIMEVEVSNQSRKKIIPENFGDKKPKSKMSKQNRVWQDTSSISSSLADRKAMTFEYGNALISRDVVGNDEFKERKKEDEKPRNDAFIDKTTYSSNLITSSENDKVENVSVSSELPVAKSKWGVKLRHVVTRDSSLDDNKAEVEQPSFYNLRELSKRSRPRSIATDDQAIKSERPKHPPLVASKSLDALDAPRSMQNQAQNELSSVVQRMKSFGLNKQLSKPKPDVDDINEKGSPAKSPNKPISLEDLLNFDKQNSSVSVIEGEKNNSKPAKPRSNSISRLHEFDQQYGSKPVKNISSVKRDASLSSDKKTPPMPCSAPARTEPEKIVSPKKTTVFGKMKSFQPRKAMSLEELLKLDEKKLAVDVVEKSSYQQNSKSENDLPNSHELTSSIKYESDFSELHKKLNDDIDNQPLVASSIKTEERPVENKLNNGNNTASSPKQKKAPSSKMNKNPFEDKGRTINEKHSNVPKVDNHTSEIKSKNSSEKQADLLLREDNVALEIKNKINAEKHSDLSKVDNNLLDIKNKRNNDKLSDKLKIDNTVFEAKNKRTIEKQTNISKVDTTTFNAKNTKNSESNSTVPKTDSNKYNKLGQIILSNDTVLDHGLVKSSEKLDPSPTSSKKISNGEESIAQTTKQNNSEIKYNKLGQIILDDKVQNDLNIQIKQPTTEIKIKKPLKQEEKINGNLVSDVQKNTVDLTNNSILFDTNFHGHHINENHEINGNGHASDNSLPEMNLKPVTKKLSQNDLKDKPLATEKSADPFNLKKVNDTNGAIDHKSVSNGVVVAPENKIIEDVSNNIKNDKLNSSKSFTPTESSSLFYKQDTKLKIDKQEIDTKNKTTSNEKIPKKLSNGSAANTSIAHQTNDEGSKPPINRKVGKLIIMTGDQRNEQLKNKNRSVLQNDGTNNKLDNANNDEEFKKLHQEGFSLSFMSNELEDDGIPDDYTIPQIVFNEKSITLKSMIHLQKNKVPKVSILLIILIHFF